MDPSEKAKRNWSIVEESIGPRYHNCRLENFQLYADPTAQRDQKHVLQSLRSYNKPDVLAGRNITLFGPPGTGKDHLLVGLSKRACNAGYLVRWVRGCDLFAEARDCIDSGRSETDFLRRYIEPAILVISDPLPPNASLTAFKSEKLFAIVDERYRKLKPVWMTLNVNNGDEASKRMGEPIRDRIQENAINLHCNWPSYRRRKPSTT